MSYFIDYCKNKSIRFKKRLNTLSYDYKMIKINYSTPYPLIKLLIRSFCRFKISIKNLMYWFRYIWNDRDWDYFFIYTIIRAKLVRMKRHMQLHAMRVVDDEIEQISECIKLLDLLIEDDVLKEEFDKFYEKYGDHKLNFKKLENDLYTAECSYEKVQTAEELKKADSELKELLKKEVVRKIEIRNKLFGIMAEHIENWWD